MKRLDIQDRMLVLQIAAQLPDDAERGRAILAKVAEVADLALYCDGADKIKPLAKLINLVEAPAPYCRVRR